MTKANSERIAERELKRYGFIAFLPIFMNDWRRRQLLLPRYIFVFITNHWPHINRTFGIARLLLSSGRPAEMPDDYMWELFADMDDRGLVDLGPTANKFERGDRLRIIRGQFHGFLARYDARRGDRDSVEVEMLGQSVRVELPLGSVEACSS